MQAISNHLQNGNGIILSQKEYLHDSIQTLMSRIKAQVKVTSSGTYFRKTNLTPAHHRLITGTQNLQDISNGCQKINISCIKQITFDISEISKSGLA
jgi:hypothetical protein